MTAVLLEGAGLKQPQGRGFSLTCLRIRIT